MHASDEANPMPEKRPRWKKCPICEDSIYVSETRPVRWFVGQEASMLREGGDVLLKLVMRRPGTTLALPRDAAEGYAQQDDIPWNHIAEIMDYARFMKGGEDYMVGQYDHEIAELETQGNEDELMFGDDMTWIRKAIAAIEDSKQKVKGIGNPPASTEQRSEKKHEAVPESWDQAESVEDVPESQLTSVVGDLTIQNDSAKARPFVNSRHHTSARPATHPFFFYHALPNFFLSPLDIRILKAAFGDFSNFPSTILPRVEHISTGHMIDDDLRKRAKYMAHLPYGCEVTFLECDWTDLISPTILDQFHEDIEKRRKRNTDKEAREERDRIRAEKEEEDKRWASARRRRPSIANKSFSETDFQPLAAPEQPFGSSADSGLATTPPWANARTHSSFATLASPGTSPDAPRTVWGTAAITPMSPSLLATHHENAPVGDGWLQNWEEDLLDERDAVAIVQASINGEGSSRPAAGGKKGKKKQKITLMSTGNRRGA